MAAIGSHTRRMMGPSMNLAAVVAMDLVVSAAASPVEDTSGTNHWSPGLVACGLMAAVTMLWGFLQQGRASFQGFASFSRPGKRTVSLLSFCVRVETRSAQARHAPAICNSCSLL